MNVHTNYLRHPVSQRLRALASVGAIADDDDFAELHLTGAGKAALLNASQRCAQLYGDGNRAGAIMRAEELCADLFNALPIEQRASNYVRRANSPAKGVTDPAALAELAARGGF